MAKRNSGIAERDDKPALPGRSRPAETGTLADHLFATVSRAMTRIRRQMRHHGAIELTVPQYRALRYVERHPDTNLSDLAENLGMSASSASTLVQRLVRVGHLERAADPAVRTRIQIRLSRSGAQMLRRAEAGTRNWLSNELANLRPAEQRLLEEALSVLAKIGIAEDEP